MISYSESSCDQPLRWDGLAIDRHLGVGGKRRPIAELQGDADVVVEDRDLRHAHQFVPTPALFASVLVLPSIFGLVVCGGQGGSFGFETGLSKGSPRATADRKSGARCRGCSGRSVTIGLREGSWWLWRRDCCQRFRHQPC